MSKIFKNMIPYWKIVIAIIGLLVVQAWCDLSLPSYTSDIIDVGIQNHGVEHVMPEKIQEEEFQTAQFIMTDQEKRIWNDIYVKKGDTKVLKNLSQDRLEELDEQLALPLIMNYQMSAMEEKTFEKWWRARWHPEAKITAARMTQRVKAAKMPAARMAIVPK